MATRAPHRWSVRGAWASQGMRLALLGAIVGPVITLVGVLWPWSGSEIVRAMTPGLVGMIAFMFGVLALALATVVRGPGRGTVVVSAVAAIVVSCLPIAGIPDLLRLPLGLGLFLSLLFLPAYMSMMTIRLPLRRQTIKLYPATAARVEITRDHEGNFAVRHPDGRVLAKGPEAVQLLQAIAGPLIDHGLLWGGDSAGDTRPVGATALGERFLELLPARTTIARRAHSLPMEVWEALLGLEGAQFPVVAGQLAGAATPPPGGAVGPAADGGPAVD